MPRFESRIIEPMNCITKSNFVAIFTFMLVATLNLAVGAATPDTPNEPFMLPGNAVIQLVEGVYPQTTSKAKVSFGKLGLDLVADELRLNEFKKVFPWRTEHSGANEYEKKLAGFYRIHFPDSIPVEEAVRLLSNEPDVLMAEPVWIIPVSDLSPNDPKKGYQWFINKINLPSAWGLQIASDTVKLAMIDTGVNYKHPDLQGNIWVNPGEDVDGDGAVYDEDDLNGVDDDGNGIIDDLIGYDFLTDLGMAVPSGEDRSVVDSDPMDFHGHGTHCSGISAAMTNNITGGVGIAGGWSGGSSGWSHGAQIICLRVGGSSTSGNGYVNSVDCATAIDYATLMGADVINCSWGGSSVQHIAIVNAFYSDVLVVHAAGNGGANLPDYLDIELGSVVMSVASTTSSDRKAYSSNYGNWVDISAPGNAIYSTVSVGHTPSYATWSGTSMAAPMVGGLALLIRSVKPDMPVLELMALIESSADNIDAQNSGYIGMLGAGRINVAAALAQLSNANFSNNSWQGEPPLEVDFTDLSPNLPSEWNWSFGTEDSSQLQHPTYTYDSPGVYTVSLGVTDTLGEDTETRSNLIWVHHDSIQIGTGSAGWNEQVEIPVYFNNSAFVYGLDLVFTYNNPNGITWIDANVNGLRTESSFTISSFAYSSSLQARGVRLTPAYSGASLAPDTGAVINLVFEVPYGADLQTITLDTISWFSYRSNIITEYGDYWPVNRAGSLEVIYNGCCGLYTGGMTGNTNCDEEGLIDLSDISRLIDNIYISKVELCCTENGNTDGDIDGGVDLADITRLIDYVYISKQPTEPCE